MRAGGAIVLALTALTALAGCGGGERPRAPAALKVGAPYSVNGQTHVPADAPRYDEVGYASIYGAERAASRPRAARASIPRRSPPRTRPCRCRAMPR